MAEALAAPGPARGRSTGRIVLIATAAALGGFLFGFDTAVINGAVGAIDEAFGASAVAIGFAVSSALLGSALGAFTAGWTADRIGRVRTMRIAAVLFLASSLGAGLAFDLWDFSLWRFLGGVAVGQASVIAPAYIAEIAPADLRGRLGSLQQLAIVVGIFLALLGDYALAEAAGSASNELWWGAEAWRWMFWTEIPAALLYGAATFVIPFSPRFLVMKGRDAEALAVLEQMEGDGAPARLAQIRQSLQGAQPRMSDVRGPRFGLMPVVWVGIGLAVLQQFVGINVIFYYSSTLWQSVGFSESNSLIITVITSVINILTTLLAIAYIDRVGRRPLLLIGSVGMAFSLAALAVLFVTGGTDAAGDPELGDVTGPLALVAANLFVVFFGFSWGPVMWVLLGEMFPNRIRAAAASVAATANWLANFVVSTTFPPLADAGLGIAYGLYAAGAVVSFFFVKRYITETKGKQLEEM